MDGAFERISKRTLLLVLGVVIILLLIAMGFVTYKYLRLQHNPQASTTATTNRIVGKVGKLYALPDETPTIAQIQDKTKLNNNEFFGKAQNGDYVLIFATHKLAIIYREQQNILITVGPINAGAEAQNPTVP